MVDRLERLTNLVALLLNAQRPLTLEELGDAIEGYAPEGETRRQAFERDKRLLRDEGVPIEVVGLDDGRRGYRIQPSEYHLPELDLTDDERVALNVAVAAVHLDAGWDSEAMWKLGHGGTDVAPALAALPATDVLPELFDGWRRRAPVSFGYRGEPRTVEPYGLLFRGGFWYVAGRDTGRDAERVFRVDRIDGRVTRGEPGSYEVPAGFDLQSTLPARGFQVPEQEPETVFVEIDGQHAVKAVADLGEDAVTDRRSDGSVVVQVTVSSIAGFRSWLFGFLEHARVLEPARVREEVVTWLEAMARG